ncbi:MAG: hypothetical protein HC915_09365 [Anaerolineae bacterium]|nr:hypothetical protein [Anaerolineae bacterium]
MDDKPQKRASLRGRGQEIMRGLGLGKGQDQPKPEDAPYFENEQDLMAWMEQQAAAETAADASATPSEQPAGLAPLLSGENLPDVRTQILANRGPEPGSGTPDEQLDALFGEADPDFDEVFGQQLYIDPQGQAVYAAEEVPYPAGPTVDDPDFPDFDALLEEEPAPVSEPVEVEASPQLYDEPELTLPPDAPQGVPQAALPQDLPTPAEDELPFALLPEDDRPNFPDFDEDEDALALETLAPTMTASWGSLDDPEPEEFSPRTLPEGLDDIRVPRADRRSPELPPEPEELYGDENDIPAVQDLSEADAEDFPDFSELAEEIPPAAPAAPPMRSGRTEPEPTPVAPAVPEFSLSAAPVGPEAMPFALSSAPENIEAIPPIESHLRQVNLQGQRLERGALAGITPQAPEELPPGQRPPQAYADAPAETVQEEAPAPIEDPFFLEPEDAPLEPLDNLDLYTLDEPYEAEEGAGAYPYRTESVGGFEVTGTAEAPVDLYALEPEEALTPPTRSGAGVREIETPFRQTPRARVEEALGLAEIETYQADPRLLEMLVDDNRIRDLFDQIEALQDEIVLSVRGSRGNVDEYQRELLRASNLLLQSRENYDESRAIIYRVRADVMREKRVREDIERYRPLLMNYLIGFAIALVTLLGLGQLFIGVAENAGVEWIGQGYYPAVFGAFGAWLFTLRTLQRHTTIDRDFDPIHVNWYIINPFVGLLMGFMMYLIFIFAVVSSVDLNVSSISDVINPYIRVDLLLAFLAGYQQNTVINALDVVRQRFVPGGPESDTANQRRLD